MTNKDFSQKSAPYSYESKFPVNLESEEFENIKLPFSEFEAYYRGSLVEDAPPLDLDLIGTFGFQTFGGVYDEYKQTGVGSLEINYVAYY